jgi:hypothetical protein
MRARIVEPSPLYQIKVTLQGLRPPVWRRLQVPGDISLSKLHQVLQVAMGWTNSHLHQFKVGEEYYGEAGAEFGLEVKSERRAKLNQVAPAEKSRFLYEYDFGDSWEHEILVEKILPPAPGVGPPVCLAGKRACPPEDCGGVWGYAEMLDVLQHPNTARYEEITEWLGGEFDAEAFPLDAINADLKRIR